MYAHKNTNNALVRLVLIILTGSAMITGSALTAESKGKISKSALKEMIVGAKSPADHKAIADYYYAEAAKATALAEEHEQMATWYQRAGEGAKKTPYAPGTIEHCERLIKNYRATAEELTALGNEHAAMAARLAGTPFTPATENISESSMKKKPSERVMKGKAADPATKEMIAGAKTAADHQAIADYYSAEAAKARAKADEHKQMASWYRQAGEGIQKTPYAPGTMEHCQRLVERYRATAEELTALGNEQAAKAAKLSGIPFTPATEKISEPSMKNKVSERVIKEKASDPTMKEMIAGAKTAADHRVIADYYNAEAAKARAKADEHEQMATWYRQAGEGTKKTPDAPGTIEHCQRLVENYRATAEELTALAKEHETMAAKVK